MNWEGRGTQRSLVQFKALDGNTEQYHRNSQSSQPVSGNVFELDIQRIIKKHTKTLVSNFCVTTITEIIKIITTVSGTENVVNFGYCKVTLLELCIFLCYRST